MSENIMDAKFGRLLKRSNSKLREDRGQRIVTKTEKKYRRQVEDLEEKLSDLQIERNNLMDINPSNTDTIINPSDFDTDKFVLTDLDLGIKMREVEIRLDIAKKSYKELFGISEPIKEEK